MNRWLVKTDPDTYAFADLAREGTTRWEGVKNPLALRHLRAMAKGDEVLVYETGDVRAVVGTATVVRGSYEHEGSPVVDLRAGRLLPMGITLAMAKADPILAHCPLVRMGRLSVLPLSAAEWERLVGG